MKPRKNRMMITAGIMGLRNTTRQVKMELFEGERTVKCDETG